jgi:hypothetical protein
MSAAAYLKSFVLGFNFCRFWREVIVDGADVVVG